MGPFVESTKVFHNCQFPINSVACIINLNTRSMNSVRISIHHPKWIRSLPHHPLHCNYKILRSFAFVNVTNLDILSHLMLLYTTLRLFMRSWPILDGQNHFPKTVRLQTQNQLRTLVSKTLSKMFGAHKHTFGQNKAPSSWFLAHHHPAELTEFPSPRVF